MSDRTDADQADVLVIFGITGDLARVMTFHALYRLERRGLLSCPIVGVAVDHWSTDDLDELTSWVDQARAPWSSRRRCVAADGNSLILVMDGGQ